MLWSRDRGKSYPLKKCNKKLIFKKPEIKSVDDLYEAQFKEEDKEHKSLKLSNEKILSVRKLCRDYVTKSMRDQMKYFLRMGIMFDVKSIYATMSREYEFLQKELFKRMLEKGMVFRDNRQVFWSAEEQRIVDLDDLEQKSELNDCIVVKFNLKSFHGDSKFLEEEYVKQGKDLKFLGFLSEAWKYVGIQALAIHAEHNYCVVKIKEEYFICAYKRLPELARRMGDRSPQILHMARGSAFSNIIAEDPLFNRTLPIIINEEVSEYFGTGVNILCPAHDLVSEKLVRNYNLSLEGFLNEDNYFTPGLGMFLQKTYYLDGNKKIINKLNSSKKLFATWRFENNFFENKKTGERISLRSIPSWFFKINNTLKKECVKELSFLEFYPELDFEKEVEKNLNYQPRKARKIKGEIEKDKRAYKNVFEELDECNEWCISEINSWGSPIPYFVYNTDETGRILNDGEKVLVNSEIIDHLNNLFYKHGTEIWWTWSVEDLLPEKYKIEAARLKKGDENFDLQFSKSISWFNILFNKWDTMKNITDSIPEMNEISCEMEGKPSVSSDDILERTKEQLKDLNSKIKNFVVKNYFEEVQKSNSGTESNVEESEIDDSNKLLKSNLRSVKDILPKEEKIRHLKQKCQTLKTNNLFPADMVVESHEQHSDWLLYSALTSVAFTNHSPFQFVKTHGLLQDSAGNKISKKSWIDPLDSIDGTIKTDGQRQFGYGSDNLRLFFLKNDTDSNFKLFEMFLEESKSDLKLIRRISRVCLGLLHDYDYSFQAPEFKDLNMVEQIIINEYVKLSLKLSENLEKYNFKEYIQNILKFIKETFFECYLDYARNGLILADPESFEKKAQQFVLREIFMDLLRLLNPIMPFTCEDVYSHLNMPNKKKFSGLEEMPTLESTFLKFKYPFNQDLDFNGENLLILKRAIISEIDNLIDSQKFTSVKKTNVELVILEEDKQTYSGYLLSTLGDNISNFFELSAVFLSEDDYYDTNPHVLRKKQFKTIREFGRETVEIKFNYALVKSKKNECPRCLMHRSKEENKICESCKNTLIKKEKLSIC